MQLFERDTFPRFHIGESLLASVNDALTAIGADDVVRRAGFPQKWGATFMLGDGSAERYADFGVAPGVPMPQTWQVPRATFDNLLLRHAASSGVQVHERHRILDVTFDDAGVTTTVQPTERGETRFRYARARSSTHRDAAVSSRASSACAWTSLASPISASSRITPVCHGRPADAPATSELSRVAIWAGSGSFRSQAS